MTLSPYRRAKRCSEPTQQLIVFRILQERFALPIRAAYKVIPIGPVYGNPEGGVGLTRYQDRDVIVMDVQHRIFGEPVPARLAVATESAAATESAVVENPAAEAVSHLLLLQSKQGELIGIPLTTFPCLRRVPESAFAAIPPMYLAEGKIRCVSALIRFTTDEPPMFLLNLSQLVESNLAFPAKTQTSRSGDS